MEAIENEFIPVLVYNNKKGPDEAILKSFQEPALNNPVVRFVNGQGQDVIPRRDGVWSTQGIVARMIEALEELERPVPAYLRLAADGLSTSRAVATFAMHCYWEGEAKLGACDGVLDTRAAWLEGKEVVEVTYDPERITYADLLSQAQQMQCASTVFARSDEQLRIARESVGEAVRRTDEATRDAKASDQKYRLRNSPLRFLPLTPLQAVRVNSALARGDNPAPFLTPHQQKLARVLTKDSGLREKLEEKAGENGGQQTPVANPAQLRPRLNEFERLTSPEAVR